MAGERHAMCESALSGRFPLYFI